MTEDPESPPAKPAKPAKKRPGKKKGSPKSGGRQKGTPNRNSASFRTALDQAGHPLVEFILMEIASLDTVQERLREYKSLLKFVYPKLKAVDQLPSYTPPPGGVVSSPSPPPEGAPAPTAKPSGPRSPAERLARIRGPLSGKPEASG